jgi:hypothetical protein
VPDTGSHCSGATFLGGFGPSDIKEDVYALERSAKLRFVPAGHGRRYSRPSVLAIDYQAKQRCFAPFITADEAAKLLALLRTRLPMWVQE